MRKQQVILVTGCSSGIGRATVEEAAARGHRVFASARNPSDLDWFERVPGIETLTLDVTEAGAAQKAIESVLARAGRLDAVVNNAGYGQYGAIEDVTADQWRRQFEVNVFGAIEVVRAALPAMRRQRHGTIVNVSSVAGKISIPFAAPYCSSKHALEAISDALRVEVAPFDIRVVVIEPGPIATRFGERARAGIARLLEASGPYSLLYRTAERAMETDFQRGKLPAGSVARVILDAVEAERPKTRYRITRMARVLIPLRPVLSDRFFDRRMKKTLRIPGRL